MRWRPRWDSTQIRKRIAEGRGQGTGTSYVPWLSVHDFPSKGRVHRIKGWKHGRVHHLFSDLEANLFYTFEWSTTIIEIREQYPLLPLKETLAIAEQLKVKHPADPRTGHPLVMTTDFFLTIKRKLETRYEALAAKYSSDLISQRTREKLEIERMYWYRRNVDWSVGTEKQLHLILIDNIKWVHPYRHLNDLYPLSNARVNLIASSLTQTAQDNNLPLRDITRLCDGNLSLRRGTSMAVVRHLLANGTWQVDMRSPIRQSQVLKLRRTVSGILYSGGTVAS